MKKLLFLSLFALPAVAQTPAITYVPNSSVKLYQVTGDCDWVQWDASLTAKTPTCVPTASKTLTNADIMGDDVPVVFENNGEMIVTFGDTIGAAIGAPYTAIQNSFDWGAHDPIGHSTTVNATDGLLINFYPSGANHALEVLPPPQPNGTAVDMGTDDTPFTGVSVNGTIYLGIRTGNIANGGGNNDHSMDYSVLTTFNESTLAFTSGRTISALPSGLFVGPTFYPAQTGQLGSPSPVSPEPAVLIFGMGEPGASNVYVSAISTNYFWTGTDASGNPATRYFAGMNNGQPVWSVNESDSVAIVNDVNPAKPTIERVTVTYSQSLGLWLMIFSGGHHLAATSGMYFTYSQTPWGPWSTPQLIFNDCRDKAFGTFMYYYDNGTNTCAGLTSPSGPMGPTISPTVNVPATTTGHSYSPEIVGRFTIVTGSTLKLFYMISTWNPYATVMMESDFTIATPPAISLVANAEGESPTIAPNTWVEVKGSNLAPAGDTRIWQASDFVGGKLPASLDGVSVTVNGKAAYLYYISPTQINILTPPDAMNGAVQVVVTNNGAMSASLTAIAQALSPSFFVFDGTHVAAAHLNGTYVGPTSLYPGLTTPAKPGELVVLFGNGFGPTLVPVVSGSLTQGGTLITLPMIQIGGVTASVQYAGLASPGEYQFNVYVPSSLSDGDQPITASYGGLTTQAGAVITVQH